MKHRGIVHVLLLGGLVLALILGILVWLDAAVSRDDGATTMRAPVRDAARDAALARIDATSSSDAAMSAPEPARVVPLVPPAVRSRAASPSHAPTTVDASPRAWSKDERACSSSRTRPTRASCGSGTMTTSFPESRRACHCDARRGSKRASSTPRDARCSTGPCPCAARTA